MIQWSAKALSGISIDPRVVILPLVPRHALISSRVGKSPLVVRTLLNMLDMPAEVLSSAKFLLC
jgi:hypothetical protein